MHVFRYSKGYNEHHIATLHSAVGRLAPMNRFEMVSVDKRSFVTVLKRRTDGVFPDVPFINSVRISFVLYIDSVVNGS